MVQLGDVCNIKSGLILARKMAKKKTLHVYRVLTLKSFLTDGKIDTALLDTMYASEELSNTYLTQVGDILVRLSYPYTAVCIDETTKGIVYSSNFICIQPSEKIYPEYLLWFLNTNDVRNEMNGFASGTSFAMVKAGVFKELSINLPDLETQKKLGDLYNLLKQEIHLLEKLANEKRNYANALFGVHIKNKKQEVRK